MESVTRERAQCASDARPGAPSKGQAQVLDRRVVSNLCSLYASEGLKFLIPVILVPYLTRTLGPGMWGVVAIGSSYGMLLDRIIQYGFALSGTRDVSAHAKDSEALGRIVAGVQGSKLLLVAAAAVITVGARYLVPTFRAYPSMAWGGLFFGVANGVSFYWYFQGSERLALCALLDTIGRLTGLVLIFVFVRGPEDGGAVLFCRAAALGVADLGSLVLMYRHVPFRLPRASSVAQAFRDGFACFLTRFTGGFASSANVFLLGFLAEPAVVGLYAVAEKIAIAAIQGASVLNQVLFPRVMRAAHEGFEAYCAYWRKAAILILGMGSVASATVFFAAPFVVPILFKETIREAVVLTQVLAVAPLFAATANLLTLLGLIAFRRDRDFFIVILTAAVSNLVLLFTLVPLWGAYGMAITFALISFLQAVMAYGFLVRRGLNPLRRVRHTGAPSARQP